MDLNFVYVFTGVDGRIPSGIFSSFDKALSWIESNSLTGELTCLPIDVSLYDWAIQKEFFKPTKDYQQTPRFIQRFSSASLEHWHF